MLQSKSLEDLRALVLDALSHITNDELFRKVINAAFEILQFDESELSYQFGISRTTVQRWRNGNACPYHMMRIGPYNWILRKIDALLASEGTF